jgi:hypothetical protein
MARNRIIYQSQALFIAPNSNQFHLQSGSATSSDSHGAGGAGKGWTGVTGVDVGSAKLRSLVTPLERIQSANFNFSINRTDINEFGKLARIDSIAMESPTVGLDFNYYLTDGGNERKLGFNISTSNVERTSATGYYKTGDLAVSGHSALSGLIDDNEGNNYFIVVSPEGQDVDQSEVNTSDFEVIGIGNGFISDYSIEAAVGSIPTASVTVEGFNIKVDSAISGSAVGGATPQAPYVPAVDITNGEYNTSASEVNQFIIQGANALSDNAIDTTGDNGTPSALRPGDITFSMSNSGNYQGFVDMDGDGEAHLQSMSISVPMSRTVLQRLGSTFGYARVIDLPLNVDVSLSVVVSELKANNIFHALCNVKHHNFTLTLYGCDPTTGGRSTDKKIQIQCKNARLEGESFSNTIGDNQTADLTFSCQIGGSNDTSSGVIMDGSYQLFRTLPFFPLGKKKSETASYSVS